MSAARLCTARLAPLIALAALSLIAGCTVRTPGYCNTTDPAAGQCDVTEHCDLTIHHCELGSMAIDANDASAGDVVADAPIDSGTNEDHPATADGPGDGPRGDAADVFHGCVNNNGCPDSTKPVCQTDGGVCVGCLQNTDCKAAATPACDTTANKCVECVVNGDCTDPAKPICDKQSCRRCAADSECTGIGPGVCMFHLDGHCATDSETVYVSTIPSDSCGDFDPASGTSRKPFCHSQLGIDATAPPSGNGDGGSAEAGAPDGGDGGLTTSSKTLVVMRGTALPQWAFNDANRTLTVVGQLGATVNPGSNIGIHLSGGTLYIRSVSVSGGTSMVDPAILAEGPSTLHLDRSIVSENRKGGILINGAAYDITNSVIANNALSTTVCGGWGGVCIANTSPSALRRFLNNTVVGNTIGVACVMPPSITVPPTLQGSIVTAPDAGTPTSQCDFTACCGSGPVNVDPTTYHLMAGSSCIDKLAANMSTAYDYDGTPRPSGLLSDCGAFEYVATP